MNRDDLFLVIKIKITRLLVALQKIFEQKITRAEIFCRYVLYKNFFSPITSISRIHIRLI